MFPLEHHVMQKDLIQTASIKQSVIAADTNIVKKVIKQVTYIDKRTISSPLLRLEAENCFSLDEYYPLSAIKSDAGLAKHIFLELKESKHTTKLHNTHLFKIPEVFFADPDAKRTILVYLNHKDVKEGAHKQYSTVVSIRSDFKIAGYSL